MRTVLELKSSEMQDLRKQNERLQREVEDLPTIVQKLEAAQSRVEDLNVQLQRKSEIEMYVCFLQILKFNFNFRFLNSKLKLLFYYILYINI